MPARFNRGHPQVVPGAFREPDEGSDVATTMGRRRWYGVGLGTQEAQLTSVTLVSPVSLAPCGVTSPRRPLGLAP